MFLLGNFWKILAPKAVFFLPVSEPNMTVMINEEIAEVLVVPRIPRDIEGCVWQWGSEIKGT